MRTPNNSSNNQQQMTLGAAAGPVLFDAVSMMGVLEELGNDYDKILRTITKYLKPGGKVYLDFAAENYHHQHHHRSTATTVSTRPFVTKYIFPTNNTNTTAAKWIDLPRWIRAIQNSPLVVDALHDNRHNYHLWANKCYQKLFRKRDEFIVQYQELQRSSKHQYQQQHPKMPPQKQQTKSNHNHSKNENHTTEDPTTTTTTQDKDDTAAGSGSDVDYRSEAEYHYRMTLCMFAGAAAVMAKRDYQCTAYRMILKLPEG